MNFKPKDILILSLVMIISFPLVYLGVMIFTGAARIEFGHPSKSPQELQSIQTLKHTERIDSLAIINSHAWQALQQERASIADERRTLADERQKLEQFLKDLEAQKTSLEADRKKIEGLVDKSDSMNKKKSAQLAKVYAAMRPVEAAQIISTLDNPLAARILDGISDDRQKAKIISALPSEKAVQITKLLGGSSKFK